jgi:large subunit ribosomal protein L7e
MLDCVLIWNSHRAVTENQVLVPETLLKKRKSQEKARAEKLAEIEKKKKVSQQFLHAKWGST